jgi:glycosyltransferase involved in cell wall biosynthesis
MKVLLVNHLLDAITGGGTSERTYQIARFLTLEDVDCTILTLDIGITAERRAGLGGVRLNALPCLNQRFFIPRVTPKQIRRVVSDADVVHLSGHWTFLNILVYQACRQLGKPYIFSPAGALKPFGRSLLLKRLYNRLIGHNIAKDAAVGVAITEDERADFSICGIAHERIVVIPNGIDPDQYKTDSSLNAIAQFRHEAGLGTQPFILFMGRLSEIKGPDLLLEAFAEVANQFPELRLVFAGTDDGVRESLEAFALSRNLAERVIFLGFVGGQKKANLLQTALLLAIPSRREAMSIVVLEAGACHCPVLFTDTCGLLDFAQLGAGVMVSPDVRGITNGLRYVLANTELLTNSANRLAEIVSEKYLWSIQAKRFAVLCRHLVEK